MNPEAAHTPTPQPSSPAPNPAPAPTVIRPSAPVVSAAAEPAVAPAVPAPVANVPTVARPIIRPVARPLLSSMPSSAPVITPTDPATAPVVAVPSVVASPAPAPSAVAQTPVAPVPEATLDAAPAAVVAAMPATGPTVTSDQPIPVAAAGPLPDLITSEPSLTVEDEQAEVEEAEPEKPVSPKAQLRKRIIMAVVAIVILFGALAGGAFYKANNNQAKVAEEFVSHIQAGNAEEAYSYTSSKFQDATDASVFADFTAQESQLIPKAKAQVVSKKVEKSGTSSITTVALNIRSDGASPYNAVIQLVREDDRWVVYSADIRSGLYAEPLSTST